jgi:hypothetical protein
VNAAIGPLCDHSSSPSGLANGGMYAKAQTEESFSDILFLLIIRTLLLASFGIGMTCVLDPGPGW